MDAGKFVQNIKNICSQKGIKPTVACKESGVGGSFINDIERGRVPSVAKVQMLAEYLGVTTSELLGEELPGDYDFKAAFFNGADPTLTPEERDAMWEDAQEYFRFKIEQRRRKQQDGE